MNLQTLIRSFPVEMTAAVGAGMTDPDLLSGCDAARRALKASRANRPVPPRVLAEWHDEIETWLLTQEFLQVLAARLLDQLHHDHPADIATEGLPGWVEQWWAPVLTNPWSERLDAACVSAQAWLDSAP